MTGVCSNSLAPLERLEQHVAQALRTFPAVRVSGSVVEVSTSHYRVAGLSRFLKLGECVGVDVGDRVEIGEVVRIDDSSATLKPFDTRSDVTIGARLSHRDAGAFAASSLEGTRHRRARPADRRRGRAASWGQAGAARRFAAATA
jgi:flagellar biosynthesis/type III secretory pathway ATPase